MPRPPRPNLPLPNPLSTSAGAAARGEALSQPAPTHLERGTVILTDANRHSYRVAMASGRTMAMNRIRSHPGDFALLEHGTQVVVTFALGVPYIIGILPPESVSGDPQEVARTITETADSGGNDNTLNRNIGVSARATNEPSDLIPGDFVGSGPDGAAVAALHGKTAMIKGGSLAKVSAFGDNDLVQIIAGIYSLITWMGEAKYVNEGGKTSFIWRGGSDQLTQTGMDEQRYTIRLDVGHTGDGVKLEITTPEGQPLFRFHANSEGRCELFASGGFNQHSGSTELSEHPVRYHGSLSEEIAGNRNTTISGNRTVRTQGSVQMDYGTDVTENIGQDQVSNINRDLRITIGGLMNLLVNGNTSIRSNGGNYNVTLTQNGLYGVNTDAGNIEFTPTTGKLRVPTSNTDAIELGDNPPYHACRYEHLHSTLETLQGTLNQFITTFNAHTHVVSGTAAAPTPLSVPSLTINDSDVKSTVVKIA